MSRGATYPWNLYEGFSSMTHSQGTRKDNLATKREKLIQKFI